MTYMIFFICVFVLLHTIITMQLFSYVVMYTRFPMMLIYIYVFAYVCLICCFFPVSGVHTRGVFPLALLFFFVRVFSLCASPYDRFPMLVFICHFSYAFTLCVVSCACFSCAYFRSICYVACFPYTCGDVCFR